PPYTTHPSRLSLHAALPIYFRHRLPFALGASEVHGQPLLAGHDPVHPGRDMDLEPFLLEGASQRLGDFRIGGRQDPVEHLDHAGDRKSTRLNSSHGSISYSV